MQKYLKIADNDVILHVFFVVSGFIRIFVVMKPYTLNVHGRLLDLSRPLVMGILNSTPDSFFAASRAQTEKAVADRVHAILAEGGEMIDVGACSTRPGGVFVDEMEEKRRLRQALAVIRRECPDAVVSIDTFRPDVARMAVDEYGADLINDVSEGASGEMFKTVAALRVPYILMSVQSNLHDMLLGFSREVQQLRDLGQKDIILDPGFGFGKTLEQNYQVLSGMDRLLALGLPVLAGVSRKRMIHQLLEVSVEDSLNGTTAVHVIALLKGASILRVHDVREAVQAVKIVESLRNAGEQC